MYIFFSFFFSFWIVNTALNSLTFSCWCPFVHLDVKQYRHYYSNNF